MADKQPSNEKTAHLSFVNNSLHDKELDRPALWGGVLETSWSAVVTKGEAPGSCTSNFQAKSTLFSILPTAALTEI